MVRDVHEFSGRIHELCALSAMLCHHSPLLTSLIKASPLSELEHRTWRLYRLGTTRGINWESSSGNKYRRNEWVQYGNLCKWAQCIIYYHW